MSGKVVIAMSGGVDSSVAAALLVKEGYEVTGMMLKLWSSDCTQLDNACCTPESIAQARQVAGQIGIPFYVIDAREDFKKNVVDRFISDYQHGLTPNPCFACNRLIRWGYLLDKVVNSGMDFLATGHYARLCKNEEGKVQLLKGIDAEKDQSYVLSGLCQNQLQHTLFPLGNMTKMETRQFAKEFNLVVANKPDSQDLCFVGNKGYRTFIRDYGLQYDKPGLIRNTEELVVGQHAGLSNYTVGQRKGLGSGLGSPYYVLRLDIEKNEVIIGRKDQLGSNQITIGQINWILDEPADDRLDYDVKIRYKAITVPCQITIHSDDTLTIRLRQPVRDATPGQIAVLYRGDEVIGSGIILSTERGKS